VPVCAATLLGANLEDALPPNLYLEYFSPEYRLRYNRPAAYPDFNRREEMDRIRAVILDNLRLLRTAPGLAPGPRAPEGLLPEVGDGVEDEEAVHERLKVYAQSHFEHYLKCVEQGVVNPFGS
jgi:hypothetical protein